MDSTHRSNGFNRAPVCKFLLGSAIGSSVLLNFPLKHYQPYFIYSQADVFDRYQVWKVLTSKLAFLDLKDIFICSILIYYFKIFEKRLGSRKFCAKLLGTGLITTLLELLAVYLCRVWNIHIGPLPSGPLCLIYPLFVAFYCDIPRVPLSHIWGIPMTGKSLVYILGLQVASTSPESILTALCGILAGILWRLNFLKLRSLIRIPKFLSNLFQVTIGRLLDSSTPVEQNTKQMGATLEIQRQESIERLEQQVLWRSLQDSRNMQIGRPQPLNLANGPGIFGMGNNNAPERLQPPLQPPSVHEIEDDSSEEIAEDQVQLLVDMGFGQDQVRQALQMSNNDVSVATNFLLQQTL